jgi:cyclopropane-fatty-acyl-phospholipid synthase
MTISSASRTAEGFSPRRALSSKRRVTDLLSSMDVQIDGRHPWDVRVHDERFYRRILLRGSLGLGESYMDGWWDCDDLGEFFRRILASRRARGGLPLVEWSRRLGDLKRRVVNLQDAVRARAVVEAHYDLPVQLFEAMLGRTMAYTCAYWKDATTLEEAQEHKLDLICRKLGVTSSDVILELGCGFGSFARYAAGTYGCTVVGVNLSTEQVGYAREFCRGLPVELHRCDYRDVNVYARGRQFDRIVSIGMFEAIGRKNYRSHMEIVHRLLKSGGLWLLHTVGDETCSADPWVTRYIFPNGELPTVGQIAQAIRGLFRLEDVHNFGLDYGRTLRRWEHNFVERWNLLRRGLEPMFDDRFFRKWIYFLGCSRGSFEARNVDLWQIVMSKDRAATYRPVR